MAKPEKYVLRTNDLVFLKGKGFVRYVVVGVDIKNRTANIKTISGVIALTQGVPWSDLSGLDESQNVLRIVREATESS